MTSQRKLYHYPLCISKLPILQDTNKILFQLTVFSLTDVTPLLKTTVFILCIQHVLHHIFTCIISMFVLPMQWNCMLNKDSRLHKYLLPFTYLFSKCFHYLCVNLGNVRLNKVQSQPSKIPRSRMAKSRQNWVKQSQRSHSKEYKWESTTDKCKTF